MEENRPHATAGAAIRLLVLDDCELKRRGIVSAISDDADLVVVGETDHWRRAMEIVHHDDVDLAIVDPHMPGAEGMSALRRLAAEAPGVPVLAVTSSDRADDLLEAVSAGVRGYLGRAASATELRAAIRSVNAGGTVIAPELAGHLLRHVRTGERPSEPRDAGLTARERDVLRLVMGGHTQDEIAAELGISERTVQLVLARLRQKTGLRRRSELLRWAAQQDVG
jgi:DNA-binding NarL/FixJ family response regulator